MVQEYALAYYSPVLLNNIVPLRCKKQLNSKNLIIPKLMTGSFQWIRTGCGDRLTTFSHLIKTIGKQQTRL